MSTVKTLEGRLRPIYEYTEIKAQLPLAAATYLFGPYLGMPPAVSSVYALGIVGWCAIRYREGKKVRDYQKSLTNIEPFWMTTETIPHNSKATWIGRGFEWTGMHAQRVWDANKEQYKEFYALPESFHKARRLETKIANEEGKGLNPYRSEARKARYTKKREHNVIDVFQLYSPSGLQPAIEKFTASTVARYLTKLSWKNSNAPHPPVGGDTVTHAVGFEHETDQYIELEERNGHAIVFGASRTGKSRFLEFLVSQDIARNDSPVCLVDPKGDAELLARMWSECKRTGREGEFWVVALGFTEISARYNAVATFSRLTSVATRVSGQMAGSGDSGVFKDFAWRFLLICADAMLAVGEKPTFKLLKRYVEDLEIIYLKYTTKYLDDNIKGWREQVDRIKNPPPKQLKDGTMSPQRMTIPPHLKGRSTEMVARDILLGQFLLDNPDKINVTIESLRNALKNEINYYNKITASLIPMLTKLTSGDIAELISPNYADVLDERPIISWQQIIQKNGVVAILLDAMSDDEVATAVGSMFFQDLLSVSGEIYKHGNEKGLHNPDRTSIKPLWLHIDEFHAVAKGGGGGEPFLSLLNRSAGSGTRLTCYSQTYSDIQDAVGSAEAAGVILGNFNSTFMLRVKTLDTAEYLTQSITKGDLLGLDTMSAISSEGSKIVDDDSDETSTDGDNKANWFNARTTYGVKVEANEPIISPQTIMTLPKGQAFAFLNAKRLVKLRFPLLREVEGFIPPSMDAMLSDMKEKYERIDEDLGFD
ncbi:conjugative transfer system coupling protein TraD [Vibrio agarivorans]|uniref:Conjugative transfer system coupling protein TraD n=1 Tax=Vibrio agarivorans TaxID=153622 RepID=A0ABT7Y702_9VIBR|nr:conjugative transfer system coupling protein TraD [Vibrio agarivorans]MDN2483832.1 conjugative transfer system coupling protein TraD [Vibrio agarivorans]